MVTAEMKKQYDDYLEQHIGNVKKGYDWIKMYLPELIKPEISDIIEDNILSHDRSKYSDEEYNPYAEYFYGEKTDAVERDFNYAWLHHQHYNPHHWQHWVLVHDDEPAECMDMPYEYILEMFCDWWAFSWKANKLTEVFSWYEQHKDMQLSEKTRKTVEDILDTVKNKLASL